MATPKLNGESVAIGDVVYDVIQGYGTVLDTTFNEIAVRFHNGIRITFDPEGRYAGVRRLYWHDPVLIEPAKDKKLWGSLQGILLIVYDYLRKQNP